MTSSIKWYQEKEIRENISACDARILKRKFVFFFEKIPFADLPLMKANLAATYIF